MSTRLACCFRPLCAMHCLSVSVSVSVSVRVLVRVIVLLIRLEMKNKKNNKREKIQEAGRGDGLVFLAGVGTCKSSQSTQ